MPSPRSTAPLSGLPMDPIVATYVYQNRSRFLLYVLMASTGSTVGSIVIYGIGYLGGEELLRKRISPERFDKFHQAFEKHPFWSLMFPAMLPPPTPFKLFALAAAVSEMQFSHFLLAIFAGPIRALPGAVHPYPVVRPPVRANLRGYFPRALGAGAGSGGGGIGDLADGDQAKEKKNVGASVPLVRVLDSGPRGDSRPRLSGGAKLRYLSGKNPVELRSTGQPRAAVPTQS